MKRKVKKQTFDNAAQRRDTVWDAYNLSWPCFKYEILSRPEGRIEPLWKDGATRQKSFVIDHEGTLRRHKPRSPWPSGGVFAQEGWNEARNPLEEPKPLSDYRPVEVADKILLDAQRANVDDPRALLAFVNKWGVLGCGIPGNPDFSFDGVALTGLWLKRLKAFTEAIHALKENQKYRIPMAFLHPDPDFFTFWSPPAKASKVFGKWATWPLLGDALSGMLCNVNPAAHPKKDGLIPVYQVSRLLDALCLELWDQVTNGKKLLRCPECKSLFWQGRENQEYCARLCANRPTVRLAKRKKRAIRLYSNGLSLKEIAQKLGVEVKKVREWIKPKEASHGKKRRS